MPLMMGPLDLQDFYSEHKMHQVEAPKKSLKYIKEIDREWATLSGRKYDYINPYMMDDAEVAVIGLGSAMGTVRHVVNELRDEGVKAGMIKMRLFRPFPEEDVKKAIGNVKVLGVMEKCISFGAPASPLMEELMTIFYDEDVRPLMANYVHGLGGRDTSVTMVRKVFDNLMKIREKGRVTQRNNYIGVRGD
jgi:pyruvate ferredoxin oxidoreductase alpha subunit